MDSGRTVSYAYDALYRLTSATTNGSGNYVKWGLTWNYDRYGNVLAENQAYDSPAHFSVGVDATTNRINTSGYAYDANGNMTNDGNNTLVYDAENRVLSASNGGGSGTYTYDGNNLRVKKVSGSATTVYVFSGSKVIAEYDNGAAVGSPSREYIYSGGALVAKIDSSGTKYYHQDHLSNRVVTDSSGNILEQLGHYPFGESWYNSTNDKLLFTSYERDAESGNDYAMMRSYVNRLARFSSPDPLAGSINNPQSLNHYSYGLNDPANLIDPTGLFIINAPPDPGGPFGGPPDFGGGGGGFGCFDTGDDFQNENTYFPSFGSSGCLYLGPLVYGRGGGGLIRDAIARVQDDLKNKADCAKDFNNAADTIGKANRVGLKDMGQPRFNTVNGNIVPNKGNKMGQTNSFTGSINLNAAINWADPANTAATLDGKPYTYNALTAQAGQLGVSSVSATQLMDLTILHELSHYNGAIGNPDKDPNVEKSLWKDCIN